MSTQPPTDLYPLPKDTYIAFDALSLRQLIINRLNKQGVFTDQNYVGSNLASIIDIISYAFNTLIYYLNQTATESMFSEAQIYENINKIVKLLDYKPQGYQSSMLPFGLTVTSLQTDTIYTIPRYSYVTVSGISYSLNEDLVFIRDSSTIQQVQNDASYSKFLVQGKFKEFPIYTALGTANEVIILTTSNVLIDHYNIHVYVKAKSTGTWSKYEQAQNLYFESSTSNKFDLRLNSNKLYEIKFGNNINAQQLKEGDQVAVYYLVSDGQRGVIGADVLTNSTEQGTPLTRYNTVQYQNILNDIITSNLILTDTEIRSCFLTNTEGSTDTQEHENVEHIKQYAPAAFQNQYRVVTTNDYVNYIKSNFSSFIADVVVMNNTTYMSTYMKYYYDLGVTAPLLNTRALYNQIMFSNSCNFNNIYLILVPRTTTTQTSYALPTQKQLIKSSLDNVKSALSQTTFTDPVYISFVLCVNNISYESVDATKEVYTKLQITKPPNNTRSDVLIQKDVASAITNFFSYSNNRLGGVVNVNSLEQIILNIEGVYSIKTYRTDNSYAAHSGICFNAYNPSYITVDTAQITNTKNLLPFQFPYLGDAATILNKIEVV